MSPKREKNTEFPRLIVISAPSGAGKTTLCAKLLHEFPEIALSISTTTRKPRPAERNGIHYFFVNDAEFDRKVADGAFVEWAHVHSRKYGTAKDTVDRLIADGKHILFDIDVQGAKSLQTIYPKRTLLIFIHPPSLEVLRQRLEKRQSDSGATIETRLQNAISEIREAPNFDYEIVNDDLDRAYDDLRSIVARECL